MSAHKHRGANTKWKGEKKLAMKKGSFEAKQGQLPLVRVILWVIHHGRGQVCDGRNERTTRRLQRIAGSRPKSPANESALARGTKKHRLRFRHATDTTAWQDGEERREGKNARWRCDSTKPRPVARSSKIRLSLGNLRCASVEDA